MKYKEALLKADEINASLKSDDERLDRIVTIVHLDGSKIKLNDAFVQMEENKWVFIFSEHHRPLVYDLEDLREFRIILQNRHE